MFSPDDMHMFAMTLNTFLQTLIPIVTAAGGAWVMHIGHQAGAANNAKQVAADSQATPAQPIA